jgi:hypothetical protein
MTGLPMSFSEDQAEAWDRVADQLRGMGIDLDQTTLTPAVEGKACWPSSARPGPARQCFWPAFTRR